ncbi:hypothetical protein Tco_0239368, partial [Tanacetum coccineum]
GFNAERKLAYGDQYLHMGNGAQAVVKAIGTFDLVLPSGLVLKLNNCYFAPSIVRGVVSFSCLLDLGFVHTVTSNGIFVSLNGIFYFSAISVNGVFEIDINDNDSNFSLALDSKHIGEDFIISSIDIEYKLVLRLPFKYVCTIDITNKASMLSEGNFKIRITKLPYRE